MSCGGPPHPLPACIPEDDFKPQPRNICQGQGNSAMKPGPPGCATDRLLLPNNHFVCDQNKVAKHKHLNEKYSGGASCNPARPGYNPDCAVPLWSKTKPGYKGAVPYTGPYDKEAPYHYAESPYYMDNDDPRKFFISGYAGFVPNTQSVIGNVFPLTTNKGLRKFTDLSCNVKQNFCKPVIVKSKNQDLEPPVEQLQQCSKEPLRSITVPDVGIEYDPTIMVSCGGSGSSGYSSGSSGYSSGYDAGFSSAATCGSGMGGVDGGAAMNGVQASDGAKHKLKAFKRKDPHPIYRVSEGLLPTYGGHVPNQQFRFGGTFGRETLNARNLGKRSN